jgi:uncharacterized protein involved in outer membrane biogenesis
VVVFASIDSIVKAAVENIGPKLTQTEVKLDSVSLSTSTGEGTLSGLLIGNPTGFSTPSAMKLGEITVALDVSTITSDTIVIKNVMIRAPEITYEYASGGSNIDAIRKNVASYLGQTPSETAQKSTPPAEKKGASEDGGRKLIIENLTIQDGKVNAAAMGKQISQGLPAITLKDIGKASGGATAAEVVDQILAALQQQIAQVVQQMGVDRLGGAAKGALEDATKGVGGDTTKGATDALKGLFGK